VARIADTSALYGALVKDDAHHKDARARLAEPEAVLIPTEILVETVDLLTMRFGRDKAEDALARLLAVPHVRIAEKVHLPAVLEVYRRHRRLSLADAFVVQTCRALGASPFTYDHRIVAAVRA
jgi:predicted nucleic acid-binding protein